MDPADSEAILARVTAVERQTTELRAHLDESESRPWYRQAAVVLSLIAFVASTFFSAVTLWVKAADDQRDKRREFRQTLSDLIKINEEALKLAVIKDVAEQRLAANALANKRLILLDNAETLARDLGQDLSPSELGVLAAELHGRGDFSNAERYYVRALERSVNTTLKVAAARSLAVLYFNPGPLRDPDKARAFFTRAADAVQGPRDCYSMALQREVFSEWQSYEQPLDPQRAAQLYAKATELEATGKTLGCRG